MNSSSINYKQAIKEDLENIPSTLLPDLYSIVHSYCAKLDSQESSFSNHWMEDELSDDSAMEDRWKRIDE